MNLYEFLDLYSGYPLEDNMTTRKRSDDNGHVRGQGTYSASKPTLDRRTYDLKKITVERIIMENGDRKAGLSAKLDKK